MSTLKELQEELEKILKNKKSDQDKGPKFSATDIQAVRSILMEQSKHLEPKELQDLLDTKILIKEDDYRIVDTPLFVLVVLMPMPQQLDLVKYMIDNKVYMSAQEGKEHRTALHTATALTNNLALIDVLAKGSKDYNLVNIQDKDKRIPVHIVASKGGGKVSTDAQIAKLLMSYGSDAKAEDSKGRTPIARTLANKKINVDIMKEIVPYSDVNELN